MDNPAGIDVPNEVYQRWNPFPGEKTPLYVEGIHDDYEGFRILLCGEEKSSPMLRLLFDSSHLFYRVVRESCWLNADIPKSLINDIGRGHRFFTVSDSRLLRWLIDVSSGTYDSPTIRHYFLCMANEVIDVVACDAPKADNLNDLDSSM